MYMRSPGTAEKGGSWSTAPDPVVPGREPAWREMRGVFDAAGVARHKGELILFEVLLECPLRRPPLASALDAGPPAPGNIHLVVRDFHNCEASTLTAVVSGQPRCTRDALIFSVKAADAGAYGINGTYEVRA